MHRGYVKLWRISLESGLLQNAEAWQLMTWCLLKATHKSRKQVVGKQFVILEPGQFVFGRKKATQELRTSEQKIRTSLKLLESVDFLTIKSTNKYSVITVVNWGIYQQDQPPINQLPNQQSTNNQPTINHKQTCKELKACEDEETPCGAPAKEIKNKKPTKKATEIEYPEWLDRESFDGFIEHRKEIKHPATPRAIKGLITTLDKACNGDHYLQKQIIEKSIVNGWRSLFPLKNGEAVPDPTQEEGYMTPQQIHDNIKWDVIAKLKNREM